MLHRQMRLVSLTLGFALIVISAQPAFSWGDAGHQLVARIAARHLRPKLAKASSISCVEPRSMISSFAFSSARQATLSPLTMLWKRHSLRQRFGRTTCPVEKETNGCNDSCEVWTFA